MIDAHSIFTRIDSMDPAAPAELFAENTTMTLGNSGPMVGRGAILRGSAAFLTNIAGLRHRILNEWNVGPVTTAGTATTYTRHDGRQVTLPVVSIWRVGADDLITDFRVFVDLAPVFAA